MKVSLRVILFTTFFHIVKATWKEVERLEGTTADENFGYDVAMSSNGRHVAVVNENGFLLFYEKVDSGTYSKSSEYTVTEFVMDIVISSTGTRFAFEDMMSYFRWNVYDYEEDSWVEVDGYLLDDNDQLLIIGMDMSSNGDGIAVAFKDYDAEHFYVEAYKDRSRSQPWTSIGRVGVELISSEFNVAISGDGYSIAIMDYGQEVVRVYEYKTSSDDNEYMTSSTSWVQVGEDLSYKTNNLAISDDGQRIVLRDEKSVLNDNAILRVFEFKSGSWNKVVTIDGYDYFEGTSYAISGNGDVIAIGNYEFDNYAGQVQVLQYKNGSWKLVDNPLSLNDDVVRGDRFGTAVAISYDGSVLAVSAPQNENKGAVMIYQSTSLSTTEPSNVPTIKPSSGPSPKATVKGDPHFITLSGKSFDYHGECDLVLISIPNFASGSGISVHIRTTRMEGRLLSYSYVSGVAVMIGEDVLEVQEDGTLIVNGKRFTPSHIDDKANADAFPTKVSKYPLITNKIGKKKRITQYILKLTNDIIESSGYGSKDTKVMANPMEITMHANSRTHMLYVKIDGDFQDSYGLLGTPNAGDRLLGRDGVTEMSNDINEYGEEWQVRDNEPNLFQDHRAPQYPEPCLYYASDGGQVKKTHNLRRRLMADGGYVSGLVTKEAAYEACADYVGINKQHCVQDVIVMQDVEVADDPSYSS